jgi:hypothetical protein
MQAYFSKLAMGAYLKRLYVSLTVHCFSYQIIATTLKNPKPDIRCKLEIGKITIFDKDVGVT